MQEKQLKQLHFIQTHANLDYCVGCHKLEVDGDYVTVPEQWLVDIDRGDGTSLRPWYCPDDRPVGADTEALEGKLATDEAMGRVIYGK